MLGLPNGKVFLAPWTEAWGIAFTEEAVRIRQAMVDRVLAIHHVGSTAVPGLSAKPIIDIAIEIPSLELGGRCVSGLEKLGYAYKGTNVLPDRHYFNKGEPRTHQIHLFASGSEALGKQLSFRDYLVNDATARADYQRLKERLSREHPSDKFAYAEAKTDFIFRMLQKAEEGRRGRS